MAKYHYTYITCVVDKAAVNGTFVSRMQIWWWLYAVLTAVTERFQIDMAKVIPSKWTYRRQLGVSSRLSGVMRPFVQNIHNHGVKDFEGKMSYVRNYISR
jgi:hypothetical protein